MGVAMSLIFDEDILREIGMIALDGREKNEKFFPKKEPKQNFRLVEPEGQNWRTLASLAEDKIASVSEKPIQNQPTRKTPSSSEVKVELIKKLSDVLEVDHALLGHDAKEIQGLKNKDKTQTPNKSVTQPPRKIAARSSRKINVGQEKISGPLPMRNSSKSPTPGCSRRSKTPKIAKVSEANVAPKQSGGIDTDNAKLQPVVVTNSAKSVLKVSGPSKEAVTGETRRPVEIIAKFKVAEDQDFIKMKYSLNLQTKEETISSESGSESLMLLDLKFDKNGNPDANKFLQSLPKLISRYEGVVWLNGYKITTDKNPSRRMKLKSLDVISNPMVLLLVPKASAQSMESVRSSTKLEIREKSEFGPDDSKWIRIEGENAKNINIITPEGTGKMFICLPDFDQ